MRHVLGWIVLMVVSAAAPALATEPTTWLGVRLGAVVPAGGDENSPAVRGMQLSGVFEGSPAAKAGLRSRDVITTVDGNPVDGARSLVRAIRAHDPGSWIPLTVLRGKHELDVRVRLARKPETKGHRLRRGWIGVQAIDLPPALREHFGAPEKAGVMVSHVEPGSPAEAAGFELGDVVHEMDGAPIRKVHQLIRVVSSAGVGNRCEFTVARVGAEVVLESAIAEAPEQADPER